VFDPGITPGVCNAMTGWLVGRTALQFAAAAGPLVTNNQVVANWIASLAVAPPAAWTARGREIVGLVRWAIAAQIHVNGVCAHITLKAYILAVASAAAVAAIPRYTLGLEWELHWAELNPSNHIRPRTFTFSHSLID
jgi:hypothetical protein